MPYYPPGGAALITIRKNSGADVGTRSRINLIEGGGIALTVADDAGGDELDVTLQAGDPGVTYTITGDTTDRAINVGATTLNEALNVLATMARDLGLV